MTFGLRCSGPACRPHPASLPVRVPTVESLPPASYGFPLAVAPCGLATVAVIGPDWLLSSNKTLPMLGTPRGRPPGRPASRRTRASAAVQGDRPTKPMPERLPESSRYPNGPIRRDRNRGHHGRGPVSVGGSAWAFDCRLSRPEARRDLRGGSLEGYATVPTLAAGDIVITRGGRSTRTGQPTMPPTRGFALSCCTACLIFGQAAPQKQITALVLFYPPAQPPAAKAPAVKTGNARPPATRSTRTPAKPVEIARADPKSPAPQAAPATAPMPANGQPPLGLRYTVLKLAADNTPTEIPNDTVFHAGDHIRFSVDANAPGYLYIISQGSSGNWKPIFPSAEIEDGNNRIEGWRPYTDRKSVAMG